MEIEALLAILLIAAICAGLSFLLALLLKTRQSILGDVGAGLLGNGIGTWIGGSLHAMHWPGLLTFAGASVHLLWAAVGVLLVLLVFRLVSGRRR